MASSPAGIYVRTLSCPSHPDLFSRRHKPNHVSINRRSRLDEKGTVMKLVIAGVGNNVSALTQGIELYREDVDGDLPGVSHPVIDGVHITDVDVVAAFDLAENKVGRPLSDAIFAAPNNYPNLGLKRPQADPEVIAGIRDADDGQSAKAVTKVLQAQGADVLLYSLPTGLPKIARAYGRAALAAGVAVVNCTPDPMANLPDLQAEAEEKGIPLVGTTCRASSAVPSCTGRCSPCLRSADSRSAAPTRSTWAATPTSPICTSTAKESRRRSTERSSRR